MQIDETFEKENINPIVGYIFNSAKQLGLENAPNELDWKYLTEGTRRIKKLLEQATSPDAVIDEFVERASEREADFWEPGDMSLSEFVRSVAAEMKGEKKSAE